MTTIATSTIASLCYATPTALDFEALIVEFEQAMQNCAPTGLSVVRAYDDFITFDNGQAQICLAYSGVNGMRATVTAEADSGSYLVISVGTRPDGSGSGPLFEHRKFLCRSLIDRIEALHPSDGRTWIELDEVFDTDTFDRILLTLAEPLPDAGLAAKARLPYQTPEQLLPQLEQRVKVEMSRRTEGQAQSAPAQSAPAQPAPAQSAPAQSALAQSALVRPTHPAMYADRPLRSRKIAGAAVPSDTPRVATGTPGLEREDIDILREALWSTDPDPDAALTTSQGSLPHRLAIYTLNTTLMVIALPVGAAMMTYCVLGRENLNVVARTMAITGLIFGLTKMAVGNAILPFFI